MTNFTRTAVTEVLDALLREKGEEYVYPNHEGQCTYSNDDGTPSCIVGHVMARLDPDGFETVAKIEYETDNSSGAYAVLAGDFANFDISTEYESHVFTTDARLIDALNDAQNAQDRGHSWGTAVKRFHQELDRGEW